MSENISFKIIASLKALSEKLKDTEIGEKNAKAESAYYDHKAELEKQQLQRLKDENIARKNFSDAIFTVTVIWMFFILMIVICCGQGGMKLSDTVLITLITTSTANVFGFLYVVVNYLFNKDKST